MMVCYTSWQQWNLLHLLNRPVLISGQHILYYMGVRRERRFPQPWSNSTHGSLLQWGCDVPSFNIPWLYNGTWVTSHGTLCSSSPSAYLSLPIFRFLGNLLCILHWFAIVLMACMVTYRNQKINQAMRKLTENVWASSWNNTTTRHWFKMKL